MLDVALEAVADAWMAIHAAGSNVKASTAAWTIVSPYERQFDADTQPGKITRAVPSRATVSVRTIAMPYFGAAAITGSEGRM